jgi:hypothetical protein
MRFHPPAIVLCLCLAHLLPSPASAQNWCFDARNISLGGVGSTSNVAVDMVDEQRPYRAIVLPFGLLQVLPNWPKLDPTSDEFDLVRTIEYSASPIHFIVGRDDTDTASAFITDLRNGELNRDLNVYRGFSPATSAYAEGLASPNWGKTFKFRQSTGGAFQGIYAGAGPYFSMQTAATIDPALAAFFASETPIYTPNTSYYMSNDTQSQLALAITGGYRGRFAIGAGREPQEGIYVGANYHYLHGFHYEHFVPSARLDTNAAGMLTVNPGLGLPVTITRTDAESGTGFALDAGVAAVVNRWEVGLGVNGIANRMEWKGARRTVYALDSLFTGGEFNDLPSVPAGDIEVELPVDVRANVAYNANVWTAIAEYGHGYNGTTFRTGWEQRLNVLQLRGGARYIKERWEPTGGVGVNLSRRFGVDVGFFSTSANLERTRHLGIGVSMRLMPSAP